MKSILTIFGVGFCLGIGADLAFFQAGDSFAAPSTSGSATKAEVPLPKSGTLASVSSGGSSGGRTSPATWGNEDLFAANGGAPVTGSVQRIGERQWQVGIKNTLDDASFSVDVALEQLNAKGERVKADNFSALLPPSGSVTRSFSGPTGVSEARLQLNKWKKIEHKKPEGSETPGAVTAGSSKAAGSSAEAKR